MSITKINKINEIIEKAIPSELSSKTNNKITLDFDIDFLQTISDESVDDMVKDLKLIEFIRSTVHKYILINSKGLTPYAGNNQ